MRYIHVSKTCSESVFNDIYKKSIVKPQQQDQKFHKMFIDGYRDHDVKIDVISSRSINRDNMKKTFFRRFIEKDTQLTYHYLSFINLKLLRQLSIFFGLIFTLTKLIIKDRKNVVVYCDILNTSLSFGVILVTKILRVKRIAVVTDIPDYLESGSSFYKKVTTKLTKKYHGFIFLSTYMNEILNPKEKPWILLEGMTYIIKQDIQQRDDRITFLYTGGLSKTSGIQTLLDAFEQLEQHQIELLIVGQGECLDSVLLYEKKNSNIRYLGSRINSEVLVLQRKAHFLVNPRPSHEIQTKFAFPSKLIEYLASGTPVISTKLLGIPDDYHPYLNFFEDDSVLGFENTLRKIIDVDFDSLLEKANKGQVFALEMKSNVAQTKRIIAWTEEMFGHDKL